MLIQCRWTAVPACLLTVMFVATAIAADDEIPIPDEKAAAEIVACIKQLGDESYASREAATEKLLTYGLSALTLVEEGSNNADREIRYRCERVRIMLREIDLQRRLEAFATDVKGEKDHACPPGIGLRRCTAAPPNLGKSSSTFFGPSLNF